MPSSSPRQKRKKLVEEVSPRSKNNKRGKDGELPNKAKDNTMKAEIPISLSLIEWRRRQQWKLSRRGAADTSTKLDQDDEIMRVASDLGKAGIETKIPLWESINPLSSRKRQLVIREQRREAHTDSWYASWCSKLINFLNSGGRSFARYEFFYSDIDRAWFNFNFFALDLSKLGIPTDIKLTRTEWSLVRQHIRKRPRRFSRNFVKQEVEKLRAYRSIIRKMQHSGMPRPKGFLFEVPRAIKVGATVTAYSRKFCILHRGMVLDYDIDRRMYLVQFERKELGFEFCPDVEVASHGVPEILDICNVVALDGTPVGLFANQNRQYGDLEYGTCYASLVKAKIDQKTEATSGSSNTAQGGQQSSLHSKEECASKRRKEDDLIDQVVEREIVIKLIETIEISIQQKSQLLDAIKMMNTICNKETKSKNKENQISKEFKDHYAWLLANLKITSKSLKTAMAYLQIMYTDPPNLRQILNVGNLVQRQSWRKH